MLTLKEIPEVDLQESVRVYGNIQSNTTVDDLCFIALYRRLGKEPFIATIPCNKTYYASFSLYLLT